MSDTDALREKLIDAAIAHVPFDGWGDKALLAAREGSGRRCRWWRATPFPAAPSR